MHQHTSRIMMFVLQLVAAISISSIRSVYTGTVKVQDPLVSKDCILTEPQYGHQFNLSLLHSELSHKVRGERNDFIEFNVCGTMSKLCDGKSAVAACYNKNGVEHVIGLDEEFELQKGRMHFNFTGEHCKANLSYSVQILLMCEYANVKDPMSLVYGTDPECTFFVIWKTRQACLPLTEPLLDNKCTAQDPKSNHIFNLMPLNSHNHKISDRDGTTYLINVCKPTLYGFEEMCPPGSSICKVINGSDSTRFVNYGSTAANPIYEDGKLTMHFESDEKCNGSHTYSSHIYFKCDTSIKYGEPEFFSQRGCEINFVWQTSMACNDKKSCSTIDPIDGFTFDLTSLANKSYQVQRDGETYSFGICNAITDSCLEKDGACQTQNGQATSMGQFNDNLQFNDTGSPFLFYMAGSMCNAKTQWTTRIEFLCPTQGQMEGPIVVENKHCQLVLHYVTDLVCRKEIMCKTFDYVTGMEIDLSPLISTSKNYLADVSDTLRTTEGPPMLYYLNVCKPLVTQYGLSCPGGSAACRAKNTSTTPYKEQGLGFADVSLTVIDTAFGRRPQIKYLRGSVCPQDPATELSSSIEFYCNVVAGRGGPVLQEIEHECNYKFDWATNILCPTHEIDYRMDQCEIFNIDTNVTLALRTITDDGKVTIKHPTAPFDVSVCGANRKVEVDYAQGTVKVFFEAKGHCATDDTINVEMRLICKDVENQSTSSDTSSCGVVIIKETPLICPLIGIAVSADGQHIGKPDASVNNTTGKATDGSTAVVLSVAAIVVCLVLLTVMVYRSPERRSKIASLCGRKTVAVQYTRVHTDEEANLLLPQSGRLSESDDDLII